MTAFKASELACISPYLAVSRLCIGRISPVSRPYLAQQESDELIKIVCEIYVAADSQKGIVIGKGGKALKAVGTKARSRMEASLRRCPPPRPCLEVTPRTFRGPPLPGFYGPPGAAPYGSSSRHASR